MEAEEFFVHPEVAQGRHIPLLDLIVRREKEIAAEQNLSSYPCPCSKCHGGHRKTLRTIEDHRERYGRDQLLMYSILGGDPPGGFPPEGIWVDDNRDDDAEENFFDDAESISAYSKEMDPYHAFAAGDELRDQTTEADVEADEILVRLELLDEMSRQATRTTA